MGGVDAKDQLGELLFTPLRDQLSDQCRWLLRNALWAGLQDPLWIRLGQNLGQELEDWMTDS